MTSLVHAPRHCRRVWKTVRPLALGVVIAAGTSLAFGSSDETFDEYQVKAAFLYNFAKFVQWPVGTFQSPNEPIAICVLGQDPFGRSLEDTVTGRAIDGHAILIRHISVIKQSAGCQILFISSAENKRSSPILGEIKTPGVLTIGDADVSGADGIVINFRLDGRKVRFEINVEEANREKLRISSRLLSLAQIVEPNRR